MSKDWFEKNLRENYPPEAHDFDADAAWAALEARRRKKRRRPIVFWWTSGLGVLLLGAAALALWQPAGDVAPAEVPDHKQPAVGLKQKPPVAVSVMRLDPNLAGSGTVKSVSGIDGAVPRLSTPPPPPPPKGRRDVEHNPAHDGGASRLPSSLGDKTGGAMRLNAQLATEYSLRPPSLLGEGPGVGLTRAGKPQFAPVLSFLERVVSPLDPATAGLPEPPAFSPGEFKKRPKLTEPRWWIGASAHYGLSNVHRSGSAEYLKNRDSEETALDVFQTGFDIRRRLSNRFFVQTGIYFTQWTDVRERISSETFTTLDSNYLVARLIKADGSVEDIYGPAEIVHVRTVTEETYNRYSHLELPLLAGVSLPVGGRWRLDGALGPVLGILSSRSGTISGGPDGSKLPLEDAPYRNGLTFSGILRLEWMYATPDWSVGIGIMGRMALNDWAETNPFFSEKRHALGAGLVFRKAIR